MNDIEEKPISSSNIFYFSVAGITFEIQSDRQITETTFHPKFRLFESKGPGKDTVKIHHHFYPQPPLQKNASTMVYNRNSLSVYRSSSFWHYFFSPTLSDDPEYGVSAAFNDDHTQGWIYADEIDEDRYAAGKFDYLSLLYTDLPILAKLLTIRQGMLFHSNGIGINENGFLLIGRSGAGKSTLSGMLHESGCAYLGDDVMIVRADNDNILINGVWCHGKNPVVSNSSCSLKAIFFLEQSNDNSILQILSRKDRLYPLLSSMIKPLTTTDGWSNTFNLLERIVYHIPCYQVKFDLSGKICTMIHSLWG